MARLCKTQNNYAESLDYYQRALIIYKEINEENSIDVSWVYHKIAELYEEQGNHAMAQEYLSKCAVDKVVVARVIQNLLINLYSILISLSWLLSVRIGQNWLTG
ncbi:MAG: tetratricopeptide repeat protein [Candidatus Midichloria sp.]|nr:tetratricopeptide repeat protein [Candidatus Midichloria sp.]